MKISELIERLKEIEGEHGDLDAFIVNAYLSDVPVDDVGEFDGKVVFMERGLRWLERRKGDGSS